MNLTARSLTHAFTSNDMEVFARAKDSCVTTLEKIGRFFEALFTAGLTEAWHTLDETRAGEEFIPLAKAIVKGTIKTNEDGTQELNVTASIGGMQKATQGQFHKEIKREIQIVRKFDEENKPYLTGKLDGDEFSLKGFTEIEELQKALSGFLENVHLVTEPYVDVELKGEFSTGEVIAPKYVRNDVIIMSGNAPASFPGRFHYPLKVSIIDIWKDRPIAESIVNGTVTTTENRTEMSLSSSFGIIKLTQLKKEDQSDYLSVKVGSNIFISEFPTISKLQDYLKVELAKKEQLDTFFTLTEFIDTAKRITPLSKAVVNATITHNESGCRYLEADSPFGKIKLLQPWNESCEPENDFFSGTFGDNEYSAAEFKEAGFTTIEQFQVHLLGELLSNEGIKAIADLVPVATKIVDAINASESDRSVEVAFPFGKIKIKETKKDGLDCLKGTLNDVEFSLEGFTSLETLQIHLGTELIKKGAIETFYTKPSGADIRTQYGLGGEIKYELPNALGGVTCVTFPPQIQEDESASRRLGAGKGISHENEEYVGLTVFGKIDTTFNSTISKFLVENKLDKFVPQYKVGPLLSISRNLGKLDLWKQSILSKSDPRRYVFHPSHFKPLASDLDKLHAANIVDRDIKPENMFFNLELNCIFKTDLDTMVEVNELTQTVFNADKSVIKHAEEEIKNKPILAYKRGTYNSDHESKDSPVNAFKKDQWMFLHAAMLCAQGGEPKGGAFSDQQIEQFVAEKMLCGSDLKEELINFIKNPVDHKLSLGLAEYFDEA